MSTRIDNSAGSPGFVVVGTWSSFSGGVGGSIVYHSAGTGTNKASWTFTGLTAGGSYDLALTWIAGGSNGSNVPWRIYDSNDTTVLASGTVNQIPAPSGVVDAGTNFTRLGIVVATGTQLRIEITDAANGNVIADCALLNVSTPSTAFTVASSSRFSAIGSPVTLTFTLNNSTYTGTLTLTSTGTGTFSPTTLPWTGDAAAKTATYTPTSRAVNPHVLSATGSPALTPAAVSLPIVAASLAATGSVRIEGNYIGTAGSYGNDPALVPAKAFDDDLTTYWTSPAAASWQGIDLGSGNSARLTKFLFAPNPTGAGVDFVDRLTGSKIQASNDPTFATGVVDLATIDTSFPYAPRYQFNEVAASTGATAYRCFRYLSSSNAFGDLAEMAFIGVPAAGVAMRPTHPTVSPWGGKYLAGSVTVTLASTTTSASLYYTTDGSTPSPSNGTLYSGPFSQSTASAVTLRAVAYDASLAYPTSAVTLARFQPGGFRPGEDWYDVNRGILIEAHGGGIYDNTAADGRYYWVGAFANKGNNGGDIVSNEGAWLYSSTDLYNWRFESQILGNPSGVQYVERPKILGKNPTTNKWVIWAHKADHGPTDRAMIATADTITGPWTWQTWTLDPDGVGFKDCNVFLDGATAYIVYTNGTQGAIIISRLSADWLTTDGATVVAVTGSWESPVLFRRGSVYFLIYGSSNYYNSSLTYNVRYLTCSSPLGSWPAAVSAVSPFASDPTATSFNAQPAFALGANGAAPMYGADRWWSPSSTPAKQLYDSRQVWLPMTFPTANTLLITTPSQWDFAAAGPTPGTLSSPGHTHNAATLAWTAGSGTGTVTAQLQRSASGANTWANVSGVTSSPATDTGRTPNTAYDYRVAYTDTNGTAYSNVITVTTSTVPAVSPSATPSTSTITLAANLTNGSSPFTYSWTIISSPSGSTATFSNAAVANPTVTVNRAGSYTFALTVTDTNGATASGSVTTSISQTLAAIPVSPNPATVTTLQTQQFTGTGSDQFGQTQSVSPTWSVQSGSGTINSSGLYTAGAVGSAVIRAAVGGITTDVTITVAAAGSVSGLTLVGPAGAITDGGSDNAGSVPLHSTRSYTLSNSGPVRDFGSITLPSGATLISEPLSVGTATFAIRFDGPVSGLVTVIVNGENEYTFTLSASISAPLVVSSTPDYSNLGGYGRVAVPVTPSDSVPLANGPCYGLIVAGAGNVRCQAMEGSGVVTLAVPVGPLRLRIRQVFATGTTATGITATY